MRSPSLSRRTYVSALGVIAFGCVLAVSAARVGGTADAQRPASGARAVFEATHLPPLLTLPGEHIRLVYDIHCALEGVEDPDRGCDARGTVFVRSDRRGPFHAFTLETAGADGLRQLAVTLPSDIAARPGGFEYYAELEASDQSGRLLVPPGGPAAPHRAIPLESPTPVDLGAHVFGSLQPGGRVVFARWGDGPADVGLEHGRNLPPIGASAFDVGADGAIVLLDEAHRRALRWESTGTGPTRVPLSIDGHLADLSVDEDGSLYVLESVAVAPARPPLIRHFDRTGRGLGTVEAAERSPSQLELGPDGPVVLQHPSHQWMPVARDGSFVQPDGQRRGGKVGRPARQGGEIVVLRRENELRVALLSNGRDQSSWRVTSRTPLAEVQLAEPLGRRLVLVVRAYTDAADEFVVLVLDERGVVQRFSTRTDEWAEAAPLGRFRAAGGVLYRLGSSASGAFVDRYDLRRR